MYVSLTLYFDYFDKFTYGLGSHVGYEEDFALIKLWSRMVFLQSRGYNTFVFGNFLVLRADFADEIGQYRSRIYVEGVCRSDEVFNRPSYGFTLSNDNLDDSVIQGSELAVRLARSQFDRGLKGRLV